MLTTKKPTLLIGNTNAQTKTIAMKHSVKILVLVAIIASCKEQKTEPDNVAIKPELTEVLTKSYAVKNENDNAVKDTINMMYSEVYNAEDIEIKSINYNIDASINYVLAHELDDKQHIKRSKLYENGEKYTTYYNYKTDNKGRQTYYEGFEANTDTLIYNSAFRYKNDTVFSGYLNKNKEFITTYIYLKNDKGDDEEAIYISRSGKQYKTSYTYLTFNDEGEWNKRTASKNDTVFAIEERVFRPYSEEKDK